MDQTNTRSSQRYASHISTSRLEAILRKVAKQATHYEHEMKDLEVKLSESLGNFRAINSVLQETSSTVQRDLTRAERAQEIHVPHIHNELDESMKALTGLANTLPIVQSQVAQIHSVYNSGREKAQALEADLSWLNKDFYERWRCIIFTSSSPVSWRWKAIMRTLFGVCFVICVWYVWLVLAGAYRAHRHRLVWGERLMA